MKTMFLEIGIFNVALLLLLYWQIHAESKKYRDCLLFSRLLIGCLAILVVDTIGWLIDGNPIGGQIWFTTFIDGLDLFLTTTVCWCWVKYALHINNAEKAASVRWYNNLENLLLLTQFILVVFSQKLGIYYYIDAQGCYHRGDWYIIHTIISMGMLVYSSAICFQTYFDKQKKSDKDENLFVALIIFIPILGNVFQQFVYGYPTIWICMTFMVSAVYIHIQNKRNMVEQEAKNKILQAALEQAEQANAAKTAFLSRMSHDMRTPLNGILGLTSFLQEQVTDAHVLNDLADLKTSGQYLLNLINDTLDVSRIESGKLELHPSVCQGQALWKDILKLVRPSIKDKKIDFQVQIEKIPSDLLFVDKSRFEQIMMNILTNCVKFTSEGGRIELTVTNLGIRNDVIMKHIIIKDNGIGMSKEFLPHLFEAFAQEDSSRTSSNNGTGLGMAIVKQLLELMGGKIAVESIRGKGTTFILDLPIPLATTELLEQWQEKRYNQENRAILQHKRILLCEDHPLNRKIAERLLASKGMQVENAENGALGVAMFAHSPVHYYDAVLMDIRMPVMDGIEAATKIRALDRGDSKVVPIIAMTANAFDDDLEQTRKAGMNAHISKPVDRELFFKVLAEQIEMRNHT